MSCCLTVALILTNGGKGMLKVFPTEATESQPFTRFKVKPGFWVRRLTRKEMIACGYATAHQLDDVLADVSFVDSRGTQWWKVEVKKGVNDELRPLGSRANYLYCR